MPTMTGDGTGEREPLSTKQISTAQKSRMRRAASQEGSPHRVGGLFLLPKHALSAPIQSVSFWSHAGLRLFNREDTLTTVSDPHRAENAYTWRDGSKWHNDSHGTGPLPAALPRQFLKC